MTWPTALGLLVGLGGAAFLVLSNDPAEILRLLLGAGWGLGLVLLLHLLQVVLSALGWAPLIRDGRRPGWLALTRMRWARESVNALLPVVQAIGEIVRAQLLLRAGVSKLAVISSTAVDLATEMASQIVFSLLGLAVLLVLPHQGGTEGWVLAATALFAGMTGVFMAAQRWGLFRLAERLLPRVAERVGWFSLGDLSGLHEAVVALYRQPRRLWLSGAAHLASWLVGVAETWVALRLLGVEASLAEALVIESLGQAVRSAGFFIPGALGVQEGGSVLICAIFGIPSDRAVALALIRRLRDVALGLPGIAAWRWEMARGRAPAMEKGLRTTP
ncbi:lysylphosphatidylglycerol synthase domain-containing protein [Roseomonas sp. BN140053]|uniref:lysylphosphatidylglycerol synthase domain-containing protein n=1 Tax=Roseomonas sp. BN140053 TaxID=3391898 RepID=UPI0039EA7E78